MNRALSPELKLAVACCRWPRSPDGDEHIRATAEAVQDWGRFDAIVRRNRIVPLVHRALDRAGIDLPEPLEQRLFHGAFAGARRALVMARDSLRLQRAFEAEGLPVMILKGTPLAILAYGELGLTGSLDVDVLTSPEAAVEARELLIREGYELGLGKFSARQFERYVEHGKEAAFAHIRTGVQADLHWHLTDNRRLLRGIDVHGPSQDVSIPGGTLRSFADEPLFAHLCVHGAAHNWSHLKWLADLNAFLSGRSPTNIERLYAASHSYDAGRSASVALRLCRQLFGLSLESELLDSLEQNAITRALERNVLAGLAYRGGTAEPALYTPPWLRMMAAQFVIASGAGHALEQARFFWNSPIDRARIALPRHLSFVHHILRVPLWLGRLSGRVLKRIRA